LPEAALPPTFVQ